MVTSNLPFDQWTSVRGHAESMYPGMTRLTGALLNRLTHLNPAIRQPHQFKRFKELSKGKTAV